MTDEQRAELRRLIGGVVAAATLEASGVGGVYDEMVHETGYDLREWGVNVQVVDVGQALPPLTTAQQLALSVLVGEDVPLAVLVSALEDAGVFPAGVLAAVADKARSELESEEQARRQEFARRVGGGFKLQTNMKNWKFSDEWPWYTTGHTPATGVPPRDYAPDADATEFGCDF